MGLLALCAAIWTIALWTAYAQGNARKQSVLSFSRESLSRSLTDSVMNRVLALIAQEVKTPSTGVASNGTLNHLFPGLATQFTVTYGKGQFIQFFTPGPGLRVIVPTDAALAARPLILAPENDPVVKIEKTSVACTYKITATIQYCINLVGGRLPFTSPPTGMGQPWDPLCAAEDLRTMNKIAFINLQAPAFRAGQSVACP